jgi:hypothetical protein
MEATLVKRIFICYILIFLPSCAALDKFNTAHPEDVVIEDAIEIGVEVAAEISLGLPPGSLTSTLGTTKAPTKEVANVPIK